MNNVGKNKRRQLKVYDTFHQQLLSVDSEEEIDFINWCNEAVELSIITDFKYQPDSFKLFNSVKYTTVDDKLRSLFKEHKYSTDFILQFDGIKNLELAKELKIQKYQLSSECSAFIDIKGTFNRNARSFTTDRKWVWDKFRIFINEIIPVKFFNRFGVPEKSKLSPKKKQPRKCFIGYPTIKQAFNL